MLYPLQLEITNFAAADGDCEFPWASDLPVDSNERYWAPEIRSWWRETEFPALDPPHTVAVDYWSCGFMLMEMLQVKRQVESRSIETGQDLQDRIHVDLDPDRPMPQLAGRLTAWESMNPITAMQAFRKYFATRTSLEGRSVKRTSEDCSKETSILAEDVLTQINQSRATKQARIAMNDRTLAMAHRGLHRGISSSQMPMPARQQHMPQDKG